MSEHRTLPTRVVVSAVYGPLLCDIGDVHDILSFLIGRSVFTHELPAASRAARPVVLAQCPTLTTVESLVDTVTPENWRAVVAEIEAQVGKEFALTPIGWSKLADQSPMETLREMVGDKPVVVVEAP